MTSFAVRFHGTKSTLFSFKQPSGCVEKDVPVDRQQGTVQIEQADFIDGKILVHATSVSLVCCSECTRDTLARLSGTTPITRRARAENCIHPERAADTPPRRGGSVRAIDTMTVYCPECETPSPDADEQCRKCGHWLHARPPMIHLSPETIAAIRDVVREAPPESAGAAFGTVIAWILAVCFAMATIIQSGEGSPLVAICTAIYSVGFMLVAVRRR